MPSRSLGPPISLEDARAAVLATALPTAAVEVPVADALGLHLAVDVIAAAPLQRFDNSAMDGYAVRAADLATATPDTPVVLHLTGESRAGHPAAVAVGLGEAIAISTGAMLPDRADAVVRIEDTSRANGKITFHVSPRRGAHVRRAGEDIAVGATVLKRGDRLNPAALAILAALGHETVFCHRRPKVALMVSGDELVPLGSPLPPGGIHDSNSTMLASLIDRGAEIQVLSQAGDSLAATVAALEPALGADVLIVCGGISVGEHDHVRDAFRQLGVEQKFWRVSLKPGGPAYFGTRDGSLVFGLPGNPVSVFATFTLLVAPALSALAGGSAASRRTTATLAASYEKTTDRTEAIRCSLELTAAGWSARPRPQQDSHILTSLLGADCLALITPKTRRVEAGEQVEIELIDRQGSQ